MKRLVIATKNEHKLKELRRYLKGVEAKVSSLKGLMKVPHVREDGDTFKKNAVKKAVKISRFVKGLVIADDSGLVVEELGGQPGVKSARFASPGKKDADNNRKLLHLLEGVAPVRRTARFVCAIAIADNGRVIKVIEEDCSGRVAFSERGRHGFGYDPLFLIPKYGKTFGELGPKVKDRMSHRSKALKRVRQFLKKYI